MTGENIIIYCDGACSGNQFNQNKGGWGAVIKDGDKVKKIHGGTRNTTNQRMEITSCIKALELLKSDKYKVELYSDSAYLVNCMNDKWYEVWERNNWRNSKKKPVENKDLWKQLLDLVGRLDITFHKVKGHVGNGLNEVADKLAQKAISEL